MYKALIIDDEFHAQEGLKKLIKHALPSFFSSIEVADSVNQGIEIIKNNQINLVFLDVHMPSEYGFKLFDYFDEIDFEVVFTTAHSDYVMEAINKWGCLGYLMKPISIADLKNVIARFKQKSDQESLSTSTTDELESVENSDEFNEIKLTLNQEKGILLFSSVNEISFIRIAEIVYCKASDNYCEIYTTSKTYTISKPLKEIEKAIARSSFVRVHRSYLVNISHAIRMDKKTNSLIVKGIDCELEMSIPVTASGAKILMNVVS